MKQKLGSDSNDSPSEKMRGEVECIINMVGRRRIEGEDEKGLGVFY